MRNLRSICVLSLLATLLLLSLPQAWATEYPIDQYDTPSKDTGMKILDLHPSATTRSAVGQAFTANTSGYLSKARFCLSKFNPDAEPQGKLKVALYNIVGTYGNNATPTGSALSTSTTELDMTSITNDPTFYTFVFPEDYALSKDSRYALAVYCSQNINLTGINQPCVWADQGGTHSGNIFTYNAGQWVGNPDYDTHFYAYVEYSPSDETNTQKWISIGSPYAYAAISVWSLALIIGVGAVLMRGNIEDLPFLIMIGLGVAVTLFITLCVITPFLRL